MLWHTEIDAGEVILAIYGCQDHKQTHLMLELSASTSQQEQSYKRHDGISFICQSVFITLRHDVIHLYMLTTGSDDVGCACVCTFDADLITRLT